MTVITADRLIAAITELERAGRRVVVAVDGNCAAGKTTLTSFVGNRLDCNVFHMDDFFLRPEQRTEQRLSAPGENCDHERFLEEVLRKVRNGSEVTYRRFDCGTGSLCEPVTVAPKMINIVEGSYSTHPSLWDFYDIRVFMSVNPAEQIRRIVARNGERQAEVFAKKWIVLENSYFDAYNVKARCDFAIDG